jgi:hypothetical protein
VGLAANRCDMLIAGTGVAAAAVASLLLESGHRPLLLRRPGTIPPGVEALPPDAQAQVNALGWQDVLERAGAVAVEGFENRWDRERPVVKPGRFLHVERARLAQAAMDRVETAGAMVMDCPWLPRLVDVGDGVEVELAGQVHRFVAAFDATGRRAAWSRPVRRHGRLTASLFVFDYSEPATRRGRIVRCDSGWAYRLGSQTSTTICVLTREGPVPARLDTALLDRFSLPASDAPPVARRPACPQWCALPLLGRRLAVGDAAFAADPLAGQGLRFAMASAIAATTVAPVLADPARGPHARVYYQEFVAAAVRRHLSLLTRLYGDEGTRPVPQTHPEWIRFNGRTRTSALNVKGVIVPGTVLELPDGGLVRWLGAFDLLDLQELAPIPTPLSALLRSLEAQGLAAERLVTWCLRNELLVEADPDSSVGEEWPPDSPIASEPPPVRRK